MYTMWFQVRILTSPHSESTYLLLHKLISVLTCIGGLILIQGVAYAILFIFKKNFIFCMYCVLIPQPPVQNGIDLYHWAKRVIVYYCIFQKLFNDLMYWKILRILEGNHQYSRLYHETSFPCSSVWLSHAQYA